MDVLREGLALYPHAVELHVGIGYAWLAQEEYVWARKAFEEALVLDPECEDALAGYGEALLPLGRWAEALRVFHRVLELGYDDDLELMLQIARAIIASGRAEAATEYIEAALRNFPESVEALTLLGLVQYRTGAFQRAVTTLRRALWLDNECSEARVYLACVYDELGYRDTAIYHFRQTRPEDHWDVDILFHFLELMSQQLGVPHDHPQLAPWYNRFGELVVGDDIDELLASVADVASRRGEQLDLFGQALSVLARSRDGDGRGHGFSRVDLDLHCVVTGDGQRYEGTWDEIVAQMRDASGDWAGCPLLDYMRGEAHRLSSLAGRVIPSSDAESFLRATADLGLVRILQ
jgi:tetratricopeptide (TPR) repeat protein